MLLVVMALSRLPAHASQPAPEIFKGARVVPAFKEGVCQGFKLLAIERSSELAKAGLENGDVVHAINGNSLDSPEHLLKALATTSKGEPADFEIVRRGSVLHVKVRVPETAGQP